MAEHHAVWQLVAAEKSRKFTEAAEYAKVCADAADQNNAAAQERKRQFEADMKAKAEAYEAKKKADAEERERLTSQSGVKGSAARFHYAAKDTADTTGDNASRLKAEAAARKETKRLAEEKAKAEAEAAIKAEELAKAAERQVTLFVTSTKQARSPATTSSSSSSSSSSSTTPKKPSEPNSPTDEPEEPQNHRQEIQAAVRFEYKRRPFDCEAYIAKEAARAAFQYMWEAEVRRQRLLRGYTEAEIKAQLKTEEVHEEDDDMEIKRVAEEIYDRVYKTTRETIARLKQQNRLKITP